MVTIAVVLAGALCAFGWGAIECWRLGNHMATALSVIVGGLMAVSLAGVIYLLMTANNPWAWIGLPMACRYTLRGC